MRVSTAWALVRIFLRNGGGGRAVLVAGCTALVSGFLLVALAVSQVGRAAGYSVSEYGGTTTYPGNEFFGNLVSDPGVRPGFVFAVVLLCIGPLALLAQVVRLGTAVREQRLAALRLAGATPGEVRRLGALEVGLPALVGGLAGYLVYLVLRALFGGVSGKAVAFSQEWLRETRLVPTTVTPSWWQVLLVAALAGLAGTLAGALASRRVVVSPLGLVRRQSRPAPRPWGLVFLALCVLLITPMVTGSGSDLAGFAVVVSLVIGVLSLAPWLAGLVGRVVSRRTDSVPVLLAARRLAVDPRPAGRAAAAVGVVAMAVGGAGAFLQDLDDSGSSEAMYVVPAVLVMAIGAASLVLVMVALAAHGVESAAERKRSLASLGALGADLRVLEQAHRWEIGLAAIPATVLGLVVVSLPYAALIGADAGEWLVALAIDAATLLVVVASVWASARLTRSWLVRASSPENLRTA